MSGQGRLVVDGGSWLTVLASSERHLERPVLVGETVCFSITPEEIRHYV